MKTTLKPGDTITIPTGWTVRIDGNELTIRHKNYMAASNSMYAFHEFFRAAITGRTR
jgi:hypothetical protein